MLRNIMLVFTALFFASMTLVSVGTADAQGGTPFIQNIDAKVQGTFSNIQISQLPGQENSSSWNIKAVSEGLESVIYVGNDRGQTEVTRVPFRQMPLPMFEPYVSISPNGRYLTYATVPLSYSGFVNLENAVLWLVDLKTSERWAIREFSDNLWTAPIIWSPDSLKFSFVQVAAELFAENGGLELWWVDTQTRIPSLLISNPLFNPEVFYQKISAPVAWNADSQAVTFAIYDATGWQKTLYSFPIDGTVYHTAILPMSEAEQAEYSRQINTSLPCSVPLYNQLDPQWKNDIMQTCGYSIGSAGCAVTSTAMTFKYYGKSTDPRALNQCLGNYACPINWSVAAESCDSGKVSWVGSVGFSWSRMEQELQSGYPPIALLCKPDCSTLTHFVVVISGSGSSASNYTINDPNGGATRNLSYYTSNGWALSGLRIFHGTPACEQLRNAQFVSQDVPTSMVAGQTYQVSVTFKNTGTTAWTKAGSFRLGSQNPQDNTTWMTSNRVYLADEDNIATGQSKTFTFVVTAPATAGTYNFQWQMLQESVTWFGDKSANLAVSVNPLGTVIVNPPALNKPYGDGMCDSAWYRFTGYGGQYAYLTLNTNNPSQSTNYATWQPFISIPGKYKIEAYVANHSAINWQCPTKTVNGDTSDARYTVYHANGTTTASQNQLPLSSAWLTIGTFDCKAGNTCKVKLTDLNGETSLSRTVSFSAMRYTLVEAAAPLFSDVPFDYWANLWIERLANAGITGGCGTGIYCPGSNITRAQMAVFLMVAEHGTGYTPPAATGVFNDVPADNGFAKWIEQMAVEGITGGCGGGNYCPTAPVTREQMAVFLLVAEHGSGYTPPAASGVFSDVPAGDPFAPWIEQLAAEGITGGCGGGNFCPKTPVTRAEMAVFLVTAFNLP